MINKIIDGISLAINNEFGDSYEIYTESIEQGVKEPCFSIFCLNPRSNQFLKHRYFKASQFCVHYFPAGSDKLQECNEVIEQLFSCLELIEVDKDIVRGTNMEGSINDNVLSFIVNYNLFVYKKHEKIAGMEGMEQDTEVKG